jgi:hypothetical protein
MVSCRAFLHSAASFTFAATSARSYGRILGANDRLNVAVLGLNGRAYAR